ncbi:DNA-binding transcriptional response regulator [Blautia faecicola]|uniref:Response regulator n=1 Tax=Blautia faecicola TaxID=2509240 RepID=A0A4Q1RHZ1_9FIRM|nr:response regulator [Blautia faecicola]RXS75238.1 response regulator [Blautia faecicola]
MQILLIEDNSNKLKQIKTVLIEIYPQASIEEAYSFNSGVRKVYENKWNLIILDMSLPTYDITHTESGGDKKPVAGKNIMKRMLNRKIIVPVVIITQFETFDDDKISLDSLNAEFQEGFKDIWKGTIFYGNDDWSMELKDILEKI